MIPSTELRLKTMLRAMSESIMPALDPHNSIAEEQARLLMGHIYALLEQAGKEHALQQESLNNMRALATQLLLKADGGSQTQSAARSVEQALVASSYAELSLATEQLVTVEDASNAFKQFSTQLVLSFSKAQAEQGRDWFKVMGF